jgi:signal transduction histidine kinase
MSLEWKLPLLMTGVLVVVLATSLVLTYVSLNQSARSAMLQRLASTAREVATSSETGTRGRALRAREVMRDSAIARVLARGAAGGSGAVFDSARTALARLILPADSGLPVELWSTDGRRIAFAGRDLRATPAPRVAGELPDGSASPVPREGLVAPPRPDTMVAGALYESDGRVYYWTIMPVDQRGRRTGYIVQQHRIGRSAQGVQTLRTLMGSSEVRFYLHNEGPDSTALWLDLVDGHATGPSRRDSIADGLMLERSGAAGPFLAAEQRVRGTPWSLVLELPESVVRARSRAAIIRLSLISLALIVGGGLAAWLVSRRITRPIIALTAATEAVARGDYASTGEWVASGDEVARLAAGFDRMATEVEASRRLLRRQIDEAQAIADQLEHANGQLHAAMVEARESRDAAEHANRAKSDFLAVMSHELRTPLNAIGGYAQLLEMGVHGPVSDAQRDALGRISRSQAHLLGLINDVLNFAKIDAGQVQYEIDDVAVDPALAELEMLVAPQVQAKRLRLDYRACNPSIRARADRDKLRQVVINLLTNAIKFTPEGGTVTLACDADDAAVRIRVEDTGIGIPADRLAVIFDPFVQGDRALNRPHEGVGLGLAISRDLARGMGGELTAESTPGEGSAFIVTLTRSTSTRDGPERHWAADERGSTARIAP